MGWVHVKVLFKGLSAVVDSVEQIKMLKMKSD